MAGGGTGIGPGAGTKGVAWCLRAAWFLFDVDDPDVVISFSILLTSAEGVFRV